MPKNLNLFTIRLPIPALVSILHRMSGVALFVLMPFLTISFCKSILSVTYFKDAYMQINQFPYTLIFYLMIWGLIHHVIAGLRHLLLDMQIGNELIVARLSSKAVLAFSFIFTAIAIYFYEF